MAREAVDKHLSVAGALVDPKASFADKLKALPKIALFYLWWYPSRFFGFAMWPRFSRFGALGKHLRFAARASRRLARTIFHGMLVHRAGLERRQAFLFRAVDIALELFALTATVYRAHALSKRGNRSALALAEVVASQRRQRIGLLFDDMFNRHDALDYRAGRDLLEGKYHWLERGAVPLPYDTEDLVPKTVGAFLAEHRRPSDPLPRARDEARVTHH